ncbi:MAG TPA: hypothetical protein P5572_07305 [Phycisphaerae bacterium]|nr:hypothetical protein [Phycisphaerales bacterium]HRX84808.1 hypothetical protein [Phycisphaerae bacterium]
MIAREDIELAREWLHDNCPRAHIRATLNKGLAFVEAMERAGLPVETIDGSDLHGFLAEAAHTPAFNKHFVQADL